MGKVKDKGPATLHVTSAERRRFVCTPLSPRFNWLTIPRAYSKDAAADEMAVNDAYVPPVNAYTPSKAKAGDVEDATLPREKTSN